VNVHPSKGDIDATIYDEIKNRENNIVYGDRSSEYVEKVSMTMTDYVDIINELKKLALKHLKMEDKKKAFENEYESKLKTKEREMVFELIRAIGFNGINLAANKADLLDRGLNLELEGIDEKKIKMFEKEILPKFNTIKPQVLSYIFDIVSKVLKMEAEGGIGLESRSRMADWEEYTEMISRCMRTNGIHQCLQEE
jgi:hypothetical protein